MTARRADESRTTTWEAIQHTVKPSRTNGSLENVDVLADYLGGSSNPRSRGHNNSLNVRDGSPVACGMTRVLG